MCVQWNPNPDMPLLVIAAGTRVVLAIALPEDQRSEELKAVLESYQADAKARREQELLEEEGDKPKKPVKAKWVAHSLPLKASAEDAKWDEVEARNKSDDSEDEKQKEEEEEEEEENPLVDGLLAEGHVLCVETQRTVKMVTWHAKGDYFSSCDSSGTSSSVLIHRLSHQQSQAPFTKTKGEVQHVLFHPTKPMFFVTTKQNVRVYNLVKQELVKKLLFGGKWISSVSLHSNGDHLICGSFDCKVSWFDLDLSVKPFKTVKYHKMAVRSVGFHPRYPLFASGSDEGKLHVFHGRVYNDLVTNPLIVPVKIIDGHQPVKGIGVMSVVWHPQQPWLFSAGADRLIHMYT